MIGGAARYTLVGFLCQGQGRMLFVAVALGESLMVSMIRRLIIKRKRAQCCLFIISLLLGIIISLLLGVLACRHTCVDAAACVYVRHWDCVWTALVLKQSHLLTKTYEAGMNSLYRSIRCCGLANIWISDGIEAVRSLLPDSAQLHTVWLCQGVTCYQSEQHGATSGKLPSNTGNLHYF